jgi:hypothetical protein
MEDLKYFNGLTEEEVWQQLATDLNSSEEIFTYNAVLQQDGKQITLSIDIDPGGGFEGGYATTSFEAPVQVDNDFRFALHHEGFMDEIGKFFGMEDQVTGYPEFDKQVLVKTNNPEKVKQLFADAESRQTVQDLVAFNFHITHPSDENGNKTSVLALEIEDGVTEVSELRKLYHVFLRTLNILETQVIPV